jgi:hypothetical protein
MFKKLFLGFFFLAFAVILLFAFMSPPGTLSKNTQISVDKKINPQVTVNNEGNLSSLYKEKTVMKPEYYARDGDVRAERNNLFLKSNTLKINIQAAYNKAPKQVTYMRRARDKDNSKLMNKGDYTQVQYYTPYYMAAGSSNPSQTRKIEKGLSADNMVMTV